MTNEENDEVLLRTGNEEFDHYEIEALLNTLTRLRESTDPRLGDQSAAGKEAKARIALIIVGRLVRAVAGWAIDHEVGKALEGRTFVGPGTPRAKKIPGYLEMLSAVEDHRHERRGASVRVGYDTASVNLDAATLRLILLNLTQPNPGSIPEFLRSSLEEALEALQHGDSHPLFTPQKTGRKVSFKERQLQLRAIGFVYYRTGLGLKKYAAIRQVADAYGVSEETIRSWEKRLRDELGPVEVELAISEARQAASREEMAKAPKVALKPELPGAKSVTVIKWREQRYGAQALREASQAFKAAQRERGAEG
ncbi:hypothetical protein IC232_09635 [Microvirga sp. BT688]|uniref:hypothetical protein n=1 Tax=Microvirga sp. TaxID=1873136 RepID=UPI0016874454|nr:hypothetical protein [Microvirga sp.]MBD2746947.1 hypothetical protein [Microvirga sp.]